MSVKYCFIFCRADFHSHRKYLTKEAYCGKCDKQDHLAQLWKLDDFSNWTVLTISVLLRSTYLVKAVNVPAALDAQWSDSFREIMQVEMDRQWTLYPT